jgi:hypothetical protein
MASIVVSIFLGAFKEAGTAAGVELLDKLKADADTEAEIEEYEDIIKGGVILFRRLKALAAKSKTKVDDAIVDIFKAPFEAKAEEEGIEV